MPERFAPLSDFIYAHAQPMRAMTIQPRFQRLYLCITGSRRMRLRQFLATCGRRSHDSDCARSARCGREQAQSLHLRCRRRRAPTDIRCDVMAWGCRRFLRRAARPAGLLPRAASLRACHFITARGRWRFDAGRHTARDCARWMASIDAARSITCRDTAIYRRVA